MAHITPSVQNDDVYMIELSDYVLGGKDNIANRQAQQLINRLLFNEATLYSYLNTKKEDNKDYSDSLLDAIELLNERINIMKQHSDASAVVDTYADLLTFDTGVLYDNNVVKVLSDETHDYVCTYYRWHVSTDSFTYIGSEKRTPFYTISSDTSLNVDDNSVIVVTSQCNLSLTSYVPGVIVKIINTVQYYLNGNLIQPSCHTYMKLSDWIDYDADISKICNQIFLPVGSIIATISDSDMSGYIGTWEHLDAGYAIMSCPITSTPLATGGSSYVNTTPAASCASHALTAAEIPAHSNTVNSWSASSASGAHSHTYTGAYYSTVLSRGTSSYTGYTNYAANYNTASGAGGAHAHGQGSASTAYQGSNSGHTHTITFSSSTIDTHQKMIYVHVWRRTA